MKTKILILTVVTMLFVIKSFGANLPTTEVTPLNEKKTLVSFKTEDAKQLDLVIKDQCGVILFHNKTKDVTNDYRKIFNFSQLEEGTYTLCLNYDNCSIYRELKISDSQIEVGKEVQVYDPWYYVKDNKVLFTFLNPSKKNVYVKVYQDGESILCEKLGNEMAINKRFDISELDKGNYDFVVSDAYKEYAFTVQK